MKFNNIIFLSILFVSATHAKTVSNTPNFKLHPDRKPINLVELSTQDSQNLAVHNTQTQSLKIKDFIRLSKISAMPPLNQGNHGDCFLFAATAAIDIVAYHYTDVVSQHVFLKTHPQYIASNFTPLQKPSELYPPLLPSNSKADYSCFNRHTDNVCFVITKAAGGGIITKQQAKKDNLSQEDPWLTEDLTQPSSVSDMPSFPAYLSHYSIFPEVASIRLSDQKNLRIEQIIHSIENGYPVLIQFHVPPTPSSPVTIDNHPNNSGFWTCDNSNVCNNSSQTIQSWQNHSVLIVGVDTIDKNHHVFEIRNSWWTYPAADGTSVPTGAYSDDPDNNRYPEYYMSEDFFNTMKVENEPGDVIYQQDHIQFKNDILKLEQ